MKIKGEKYRGEKRMKRSDLGGENNIGVSSVELSLVGLVILSLLDDFQGLNAPNLESNFLADSFVAGVKDSGQSSWGLESYARHKNFK
jgi:hypothetical protein